MLQLRSQSRLAPGGAGSGPGKARRRIAVVSRARSRKAHEQNAEKKSSRPASLRRGFAPGEQAFAKMAQNKPMPVHHALAAGSLIGTDGDSQAPAHASEEGGPPPRALVLDVSYQPIYVINWQRALTLTFIDKVDVVEYYCSHLIKSATEEHLLPAVVRVRRFVKRQPRGVQLNRRNVMLRDGFQCAYCGRTRDLTIDHVVPLCKGGDSSWGNLVTACGKCNGKKADKTLEELGWKLDPMPREPSPHHAAIQLQNLGVSKRVPDEWRDYLPFHE
ncbi:unnamed protein product [Pedinophyceae sp. YPF-701]|nr:unnamed protein product [Pedinophyceae sp. YPF-701]